MSVTKESFRDWKANPVTKAVFAELNHRAQSAREDLGNTAGVEPLNDRFKSGYVQACQDIVVIDFDEVTDD